MSSSDQTPSPLASSPATVLRWDGDADTLSEQPDDLAREEPLEIRVRGRAISVTMRTPGHDAELAAGFLLTEGIVRRRQDILRVEHCGRNEDGNLVNVLLAPEVPVDFARLTRHVFASSSCGLCGKASIEAVRGQFPKIDVNETVQFDTATILRMPAVMQ